MPCRPAMPRLAATMKGSTAISLALACVVALGVAWWTARERGEPRDAAPTNAPPAAQDGPADVAGPRRDPEEAPAVGTSAREAPESAADAPKAPATRSVVARLVDDSTGEPVPGFDVELALGDEERTLGSDGDGLVRFEAPADAGEISFELAENLRGPPDRIQTRTDALRTIPSRVSFVPGAPDAAPVDVRIPVGPTYRLSISPAGFEAASLRVSLRSAA
jgi:hypothetical protein